MFTSPKFNLFIMELVRLSRSKPVIGFSLSSLALFALVLYELSHDYLYWLVSLRGEGQALGISVEVVRPFWGWVLAYHVLVLPSLCTFLYRSPCLWPMLSLKRRTVVAIKISAFACVLLAQILILSLYPLSLCLNTSLDGGLVLSGAMTVYLVSMWCVCVCVAFQAMVKPRLAWMATYAVLLISLLSGGWLDVYGLSFSFVEHAHAMMYGQFSIGEVGFYLFSALAFIMVAVWPTGAHA